MAVADCICGGTELLLESDLMEFEGKVAECNLLMQWREAKVAMWWW